MPIIWSGLAPHPPIIVDAVGGHRCRKVSTTIKSMHGLAKDLLNSKVERIVVISPHTPRPKTGIATWLCKTLKGSFASFGAPQAQFKLPNDVELVAKLAKSFRFVSDLGEEPLDHGAAVPLHFLVGQGWSGPTSVIGLPWRLGEPLSDLGLAIADCVSDVQGVALLASGDMSHSLIENAPCGFAQEGVEFDRQFVGFVKSNDFAGALSMDDAMCEAAHQDVISSCKVVWEATGFAKKNPYFYSYEGPFGVGYCVMRFDKND